MALRFGTKLKRVEEYREEAIRWREVERQERETGVKAYEEERFRDMAAHGAKQREAAQAVAEAESLEAKSGAIQRHMRGGGEPAPK